MPAKALLLPSSVSVPLPIWVSEPLPEITLANVPLLFWSNTSEALSMMLPCRLCVLPCSVPPLTSVPPPYVLAPVSTTVPGPLTVSAFGPAPPLTTPLTVSVAPESVAKVPLLFNATCPLTVPMPVVVSSVPPFNVTAFASVFCTSSAAPLPTVTTEMPAVPFPARANVPPLIVVPPL